VSERIVDYGSTVAPGTATHAMTLYRHPTKNGQPSASGALVFGAGTIQYAWGLDAVHDRGTNPAADPSLQQATVNLLADMGVQPATLMGGLVGASASTDTATPTSAIAAPAGGATVSGSVTVSGTASDAGGLVAGVEVSTDGGTTWHPAAGTTNWTYAWYPQAAGPAVIKSRAVDDSGNLEAAGAGVAVTVDRACPCTIWNSGTSPASPDAGDVNKVEVGVKFRASVDGFITGLRFYKGAGNTGTHVGNLWKSDGTRLATATFANETATGWQQVAFAAPVAISANTTYVASYFAPSGHYAFNAGYFGADVVTPPLRALADGADGPNGVYVYAGQSSFPSSAGGGANYWVDVVFEGRPAAASDTTPPNISAVQATAVGGSGATISWTTDEPADGLVEYGTTASYGSQTPLNGTLVTSHAQALSGLTPATLYHYRIKSKDAAGNLSTSADFTFATSAPASCPCSIWNGGAVTGGQFGPGSSLELGVRFRASTDGFVTGVRFYKATGDTGTHVGSLWDGATGALLTSAAFSGEGASGWQEVTFPAPIAVSANKSYVASYQSPQGRYVATTGYFASAVQSDFLRALADGEDGPNGVFRDGSGFPNSGFGATNYWVDAVFSQTPPPPDTTAPVISGVQAVAVDSGSATIAWTTDDPADSQVSYGPAADGYTFAAGTATLTRSHSVRLTGLSPDTVYHFRARSTNSAGLSSSSDDLVFQTTPLQPCASCSLWNNDIAPAVPYLTKPQPAAIPIEVGLKFRSSVAGKVLGVRFYKGALNTGTHVGHLWTAGGQLLATATFFNESATGWQQVLFSQYVDIAPNTVYVASYTSPARAYAYSLNYFDKAYKNGPLEALSSLESPNGVYGDAAAGFPTQDGNRTNYWVDVVFSDQNVTPQSDGTPPRVVGHTPAADATNAGLTAVTATFSEPVQASSIKFELHGPGGTLVPGALAYDEVTQTVTFTPEKPLTPGAGYTAQVLDALDMADPALRLEPGDPGNEPWSFTTGTCPCDFFGPAAPSSVSFVGATDPIELGVKFRSDVDGYLTGLRFYQGPQNTGPHLGHLWELQTATTGRLVASTNGSVEAPPPGLPGWKTLLFSPAVPIRGGQVYVAAYSTESGGYAFTNTYFTQGRRNGPIEALANGGVYGGNGVFGGSGSFPFASAEATNYWVDPEFSFTAAPPNAPPSDLTLSTSAASLNEGGTLTLKGGFADANTSDTHAVTIDWGDGTSSTLELAAGALSFSATHPYADDNPSGTSSDVYRIGVTVTDPDGGSAAGSTSVTVNNVAPSVTIGSGPATGPAGATDLAPEGVAVNLHATVTDPGTTDVLTERWSVTKNGAPYGAAGSGTVFSFTPDDNGSYVVTLTVSDDDGGSTTQSRSIQVTNVAPTGAITGAPTGSVPEGTAIALGSTAVDASSVDAASLTRSWAVTKNGAAFASGSGASFSFTPNDNGSYVVTLTVADKDGGTGKATASIMVTNAVPTVTITGPAVGAVYPVGTAVTFAGTYADPGTADTHTAQWTFAAGTTVLTSPAQSVKGGTVSTSYKFAAAGVYNVTLAVTDDDGGTGTATKIGGQTAYVVVYDPSAGYVVGSGWFNSPAGAYRPAPNAAGRAVFAFVSKYQKGLSVPSGQTDFKFQAGDLVFKSTSYDWLVIQPAFKAQYQGRGMINGVGGYAFLLTAVDGDVQGAPGPDSFRIRIWDLRTLDVVYDNGSIGNGPETTAIASGSIVIRSK
jgi:hypothetical protein